MDNKDEIIAKLKRENAYLKSLLEQNGISYEEPKEIKQYNFSDDEKIKLYLSYFVGRDDIFAYEYYTKENKRMFSPACKSRPNLTGYCPFKCSECLKDISNRLGKDLNFSKESDNKTQWKPLRLESFTLPPFNPKVLVSPTHKTQIKDSYSRILAFVYSLQKKRYKDGCTVIDRYLYQN